MNLKLKMGFPANHGSATFDRVDSQLFANARERHGDESVMNLRLVSVIPNATGEVLDMNFATLENLQSFEQRGSSRELSHARVRTIKNHGHLIGQA
jgi:hypothetical protein